jgi:hypothetical protein
MLSVTQVLEIRRLLDEDELSHREIAEKVQVSRWSVSAIANGRRGLHGREQSTKIATREPTQTMPKRCPGCGGLVVQPCRLCRVRASQRRSDPPRRVA